MGKRSFGNGSQYFGLALSFSVVLIISIVVMYLVGNWIDSKLGTDFFAFIFALMGIVSGFRVLYSDIQSIERKQIRREKEKEDDSKWYSQ